MQMKISKTLKGIIARTAFNTTKAGVTRSHKDFLALELLREEGSLAYRILSERLKEWELHQVCQRLERELPDDLPHVFISAVSGMGINTLKDMLWSAINDESNRIENATITHRPLDGHHRVREEDEFIFQLPEDETAPELEDDDEEFDWDETAWEYGDDK